MSTITSNYTQPAYSSNFFENTASWIRNTKGVVKKTLVIALTFFASLLLLAVPIFGWYVLGRVLEELNLQNQETTPGQIREPAPDQEEQVTPLLAALQPEQEEDDTPSLLLPIEQESSVVSNEERPQMSKINQAIQAKRVAHSSSLRFKKDADSDSDSDGPEFGPASPVPELILQTGKKNLLKSKYPNIERADPTANRTLDQIFEEKIVASPESE